MPFDHAGVAAQAFVAFLPAGAVLDRLVATDGEGTIIETFDVSGLGS